MLWGLSPQEPPFNLPITLFLTPGATACGVAPEVSEEQAHDPHRRHDDGEISPSHLRFLLLV